MTTPFPFVSAAVLTAAQMNAITTLPINDQTASYVALVGDVGKRIIMNVATANTVTINNSVFAVGDTIFISAKGAGSTTVTAGVGVTINTSGSLVIAQHGGGTLVALSASTFTFFSGAGSAYGTATGGIGAPTAVTISSVNYEYLTFNSTNTLTVTKAGFFDYCAIGGGGGSMSIAPTSGYSGGGGGGGQVVFGSVYLSANQTITIGAGGAFFDNDNSAAAGSTSIAATSPFTQTAFGNMSSTTATDNIATYNYVGGGAGCVANGTQTAPFTETVAIGFRGGSSTAAQTNGGGGGGQSGRGGNGSGTTGGTGGTGVNVAVFIGGSELRKAQGGGGGGSVTGGTASTGGVAGSATTTPPNGGANTGQGGGGGVSVITTGNGGSGICYIRYTV